VLDVPEYERWQQAADDALAGTDVASRAEEDRDGGGAP
jgi:hypothetical protein